MKTLALCIALLAFPAFAADERFAVYYTNALPAAAFAPYALAVLDPDAHPDLRGMRGTRALAYVSLAEDGDYRAARGPKLAAIPERRGYHYVDVRKPQWAADIVERIIPGLLRQGFDGVMLDTADTALNLEAKYPGMAEATTRLIKTIRMHYPEISIMLNRGFALLPQVAGDIDMVLAESIYATVKDGKPALQPEAHYRSVSEMLNALKTRNPSLKIYTLDYWPESDAEGVRAIYAAQRAQGFIPYVSTPDLQSLPREP